MAQCMEEHNNTDAFTRRLFWPKVKGFSNLLLFVLLYIKKQTNFLDLCFFIEKYSDFEIDDIKPAFLAVRIWICNHTLESDKQHKARRISEGVVLSDNTRRSWYSQIRHSLHQLQDFIGTENEDCSLTATSAGFGP
ncbi:N-Terminal Ef-Hand Calcium-Binding Protein 2 [Manis pentadactyla]|nr:N-Terminal Ef-Hand Calcium-Binding Protein 2 [Manis pentadactyla]